MDGKRNGKGKLYDIYNQLIFEGEFFNNKKLKGKEYHENILEFEGEYLCGNKWNGIVYDSRGNVKHEIINGNGKVKEYYDDGQIRFIGEYLNGLRNGTGKEFDIFGGTLYEGEYSKGKKIGKKNKKKNNGDCLII